MGISDFFKKKPSSTTPNPTATPSPQAAKAPQPASNPGMTTIDREHFTLLAPFQWIAVPSDNPMEFEFRNQTLREQLIITILLAREPFSPAQVVSLPKDLAEKRLRALDKISNGNAVNSPLQLESGSGQSEARCFGHDESNKVRFAFVVRVSPAKVVTVALTRYFLEDVGSPLESYAGMIFDFLKVKNPGGPAGT